MEKGHSTLFKHNGNIYRQHDPGTGIWILAAGTGNGISVCDGDGDEHGSCIIWKECRWGSLPGKYHEDHDNADRHWKGKMDDVVTFSADAVYKNEGDTSHISRDLEEQMTLEQCLYGVMLESANECAYAVAEHIGGGDVSKFVDMMNEKAKELGCTNTHFNNTNGLPDRAALYINER